MPRRPCSADARCTPPTEPHVQLGNRRKCQQPPLVARSVALLLTDHGAHPYQGDCLATALLRAHLHTRLFGGIVVRIHVQLLSAVAALGQSRAALPWRPRFETRQLALRRVAPRPRLAAPSRRKTMCCVSEVPIFDDRICKHSASTIVQTEKFHASVRSGSWTQI